MTLTDQTEAKEAPKRQPPKPPAEVEAGLINHIGTLSGIEGLGDDVEIEVRVLKVKARFGHIDALVTPVAGAGEKWVLASRLTNLRAI